MPPRGGILPTVRSRDVGRSGPVVGGEGRDRTADTAVFSRVLYRLSYLPDFALGLRSFREPRPVSEPFPTRSPSAPDGLRSRDLLLDREVRTTGLLYGRICGGAVPPTGFEPVLPP
jgi:hypothetical protein